MDGVKPTRAIVFVHRNESASIVAAKLAHHKVAVADLHWAVERSDRKRAMDDFRDGRVTVLVASALSLCCA